ncbi:MAG: PKD domain-containing protein [Saprospiraceae bacterium]
MKLIILLLSFFLCQYSSGQSQSKKVLFLGNSYTYVNNLPQMVSDMAISAGDALIYDSNAIGGYTLKGHSSNSTSLAKIATGNWDYVVLQEQSQLPAAPIKQVESEVFPYAQILDSIINAKNSCAETVFYRTWGRKNGDSEKCASWPQVCTYQSMDSLLQLRYMKMAIDNEAILSPVGEVWKYLRRNFPKLELYSSDESHPAVAGTYAAACCFYTILFRKDPGLITFNAGLQASDAAAIRAATKIVIFENLTKWKVGTYDPIAKFSYTNLASNQFVFKNNSANANSYLWNFGDGNTSTEINPTHTYASSGMFETELQAIKCNLKSSAIEKLQTGILSATQNQNEEAKIIISPNPVVSDLNLKIEESLMGSTYEIFNLDGKVVDKGNLLSLNNLIETPTLSNGFYILCVGSKFKKPFVVAGK